MASKNIFVTIVLPVLALAGGAWIGFADSRSDDVFITLGLLMGFCALLGLVGQRRPWLWPPLVGIWVPVLDSVLPRLGVAPQRPGESFSYLSTIAVTGLVMAVCFVGAYLGAFVGWSVRNVWPGASEAGGRGH
ncbi:MAG TPA: hypothetical protein VG028_03055 [Terriglobia bacterium]|nr:hypothetical protein [Terriglobia bacterium]